MIYNVLEISTAHISEETFTKCSNEADNQEMYGASPFTMHLKGEYGLFVHVLDYDDNDHDLSDDLRKCVEYARKNNCVWIIFDSDAEEIEDLEIYEW